MRAQHVGAAVLAAALAISGSLHAEKGAPPDSLKPKRTSLVALPYAYYTPETKFAFGAGGVYSFRPADAPISARPSSVKIAVTYTQLRQMILALQPDMYLGNERYYFSAFYGYYKFPSKFWGIGSGTPDQAEEKFERNDFESSTDLQKRIVRGLYVGLRYQYQRIEVKDPEPEGVLRDREIPGSRGGIVSGLGAVVNYDTRDHVYQPSRGFLNQLSAVSFGPAFGSDYAFTLLIVDMRKYFNLFGSHVLALQTYDGFVIGSPPFQMTNMLGGSYYMRGYYHGRYRDKNLLTLQAEYRFPIVWRLGAVGFLGLGDVHDRLDDFRHDPLELSAGFGLRFLFDAQERINARLDVGFGRGDNSGIYAMVLEAF